MSQYTWGTPVDIHKGNAALGKAANGMPPAAVPDSEDGSEYLAFRLGGQEYAVNILDVREIRHFEQPTRLVGSAPYALGVLNLRGAVVPVLDLRLRVGLVARFNHQTVIVVMSLPSGRVGLVVDAVSDVVTLADSEIQPLPAFSDSGDGGLYQGLACLRQGSLRRDLTVMNVQGLLAGGKPLVPSGILSSSPATALAAV